MNPAYPADGSTTPRGRLVFSPARVGLIARHTFLAAVRQRVFGFLLVLAGTLVGGGLLLRDFDFGASELKFLTDFGLGTLVFFGSILTIVVTAQLFCGEIEHRTALPLLARPVRRSEFVLGKFLGAWLVTAVFCALVVGLLGLLLRVRETALLAADPDLPRGGLVCYRDLAAAGLLQWVKFGVLGAMTLLAAGLATTNLCAVGLSFLALVVCHLQYLARDAWQTAGTLSGRIGGGLLGLLFPNFQLFNAGELLAAGRSLEIGWMVRIAAYGFAYMAVFLALAVHLFRRREI